MTLLELNDVSKEYAPHGEVLKQITLAIEKGDFILIRGRSGIGKTTLLRIIGLLDKPTSGRVILEGRETNKMNDTELSRARLHSFGFVFQQFNLIPSLTNQENAELPLELAGVPSKERRERVRALLSIFGLDGHESKYPGEISGGEQQRVTIARAVANNPKILLADEPTTSLDETNAKSVMNLFEKMNRERGIAVILTTTSFSEVYNSTKEFTVNEGTLKQK